MPRPRRFSTGSSSLSGAQAQYVLSRLIRDRRVNPGDISRALDEMQGEIEQLEQQLQMLRAATGTGGGSGAPARRGPGRPPKSAQAQAQPGTTKGRKRRRRSTSPENRASQQLQGQYLGYIRQIPETRRAKYKKIAKADGREAAIKQMRAALGK